MKIKKQFLAEDGLVFSKKKHSKLHDFAGKKSSSSFEENGIITDRDGNLIKIGSFVEFFSEHSNCYVEGEVVEIHANNLLNILHDDIKSNEISTHSVNSWDVAVITF